MENGGCANLSKRAERKHKKLKKEVKEFLLLSGMDPTTDVKTVLHDGPRASETATEEVDISMKVSRKLHKVKMDRAPCPEIVLNLERLSGLRVGSQQIAELIHYTTLSQVLKPVWLRVKPNKALLQTVVVRVNCDLETVECSKCDSFVDEMFGARKFMRLRSDVADRDHFWKCVFNVPLSKNELMKEMFEERGLFEVDSIDMASLKQKLLMSVRGMLDLAYPFPTPGSSADSTNSDHTLRPAVLTTKKRYGSVGASSPLFAIDCEMCVTEGGESELTRISMVDENFNVVLDTLVKPDTPITDYVTKFSGITKKMLDPVDVRLADVQAGLSYLLPNDAILVGHSLEFDMRALRLSHPYCMDVSFAFNLSGSDRQRSALRTLAHIFLDETIQDQKGHCSVEDATAAMKLAKLKLKNGLQFGNVQFGWNFEKYARENGLSSSGARLKGLKRKHFEADGDNEDVGEGGGGLEVKQDLGNPGDSEQLDAVVVNGNVNGDTSEEGCVCCECGMKTTVACFVNNCACKRANVTLCVRCCARKKVVDREGLEEEKGNFDWSEAIRVDSHSDRTRPLGEHLKNTKNRTAFFAIPDFPVPAYPRVRFVDTNKCDSAADVVERVRLEMFDHHLVMVELSANQSQLSASLPELSASRSDLCSDQSELSRNQSELVADSEVSNDEKSTFAKLDNAVERLLSCASRNALLVLIFSSPQESILYLTVKAC